MATVTTSAYDTVSHRLAEVTGYRPPGERGDWRCPAHDDSTASLSVTRGAKGVVIHCHAGCEPVDVMTVLGLKMSDLFDGPTERAGEEPNAVYRYVTETGELLFEVLRFPGKQFRQRRPDPQYAGEWVWKLGDTRRVLYRFPRVLAALGDNVPIFVVEGEKDVHAIERAGGVATCNAGGAGKWKLEYADVLRGADVVIVADQDPPGIKHAADVEASLVGRAARVRVVAPLAGKDAADHLAAGHTLDDWLRVADPNALQRSLLGGLVAGGVPLPTMVHPWLYAGGLHVLQSEPGVGKSWISVLLAMKLVGDGYSVVYLDEEGGDELVAERLVALGADPEAVDRLFFYYPFPQRAWTPSDIEALRYTIREASKAGPVGLGVFDSLPDFLAVAGRDEDKARDVTQFVHDVMAPFREVGAAFLVLDHLNKPASDGSRKRSRYSRGSGAKLAKAHLTLLLETVTEFNRYSSGQLRLFQTKDRRGYTGLPDLRSAGLLIDVTVTDGQVHIAEQTEPATAWDGPTKCMEEVLAFLTAAGGVEFSENKLLDGLRRIGCKFRESTITEATERLVASGRITFRRGARNAKLYSCPPGTQTADVQLPTDEDF